MAPSYGKTTVMNYDDIFTIHNFHNLFLNEENQLTILQQTVKIY